MIFTMASVIVTLAVGKQLFELTGIPEMVYDTYQQINADSGTSLMTPREYGNQYKPKPY